MRVGTPISHFLMQTERVTYSRGVQTASDPNPQDEEETPDQTTNQAGRETEDDLRKRLEAEFEVEKEKLERQMQEIVEEERKREEKLRVIGEHQSPRDETALIPLSDLSEEERLAILETPEFSRFLEDSGKIIQRALSDGYDYIRDYAIGGEQPMYVSFILCSTLANWQHCRDSEDPNSVKPVCIFSDERWTSNRSVTGIDWSPKVSLRNPHVWSELIIPSVPRIGRRVLQQESESAT
jgi:dynein intermediate chain